MGGWGAVGNMMKASMLFTKVEKDAEKKCRQAIYDLGAKILKQAKENAPVRTGALRRSGRITDERPDQSKFANVVISFGGKGTGVDYAYFQEVGTSHNQGRFYLGRAVRKYSPQLTKYNLRAFEGVWDSEVVKFNAMSLIH